MRYHALALISHHAIQKTQAARIQTKQKLTKFKPLKQFHTNTSWQFGSEPFLACLIPFKKKRGLFQPYVFLSHLELDSISGCFGNPNERGLTKRLEIR